MPSKKKPETAELDVPKELLDQLVKGPMTQGDLDTLFRSLKKAVIERAMNAEMTGHLGYAAGEDKPEEQSNHRNGTSGKAVTPPMERPMTTTRSEIWLRRCQPSRAA
jgi:hypothetical protein